MSHIYTHFNKTVMLFSDNNEKNVIFHKLHL